jgi:hypothetical protein
MSSHHAGTANEPLFSSVQLKAAAIHFNSGNLGCIELTKGLSVANPHHKHLCHICGDIGSVDTCLLCAHKIHTGLEINQFFRYMACQWGFTLIMRLGSGNMYKSNDRWCCLSCVDCSCCTTTRSPSAHAEMGAGPNEKSCSSNLLLFSCVVWLPGILGTFDLIFEEVDPHPDFWSMDLFSVSSNSSEIPLVTHWDEPLIVPLTSPYHHPLA